MKRYRIPVSTILVCLTAVAATAHGQAPSPVEANLVAVLASDKPEAEKAMTCKLLAVHGTAAAVPELSKLLSNERLSSWARIALEAIPDPSCDAALREAAESLSGRLAVGAINSLGVRRDEQAVELLARKLDDEDALVAAAAAAALGKIGDASAAAAVRQAFTTGKIAVQPAAAQACVECAEALLNSGRKSDAVALYDLVRGKSQEPQRVLEAIRGAILARGDEGLPLLLEQLRSSDRGRFRIGLSTARELPGDVVDAAIAAELAKADPARGSLLVVLLADRGRPAGATAILNAAGPQAARGVRLEALRALGRVGDARAIPPLLAAAADADASLADAAAAGLAELRGQGIDREILSRLPESKGRGRVVLLELIGRRRIDAVPQVIDSLDGDDAAVRSAAITALGEIVDLPRLPVLVERVKKPRDAESGALALKSLSTACVRMPDRDACASALSAAMQGTSGDTRIAMLDIIGQVGGPKALEEVAAAAKSGDEPLQDAGTRLLGDWLTPDAGPVLLELAKTLPDGKFRTRAYRGYLRVARQFGGSPDEKAAMCGKAMEIARDADDRRTVLDALKSIPAKGSLELAAEAAVTPELRDAARTAAAAILGKSGDSIEGAWNLASRLGLPKAKIEIVKATYGAGGNQRDVSDAIRKRAGSVPLIVLTNPTYNDALGGDPAPDAKKQLVISYKLDGKQGEVALDENAPILLPTP
jgi:HEAT repeat protein